MSEVSQVFQVRVEYQVMYFLSSQPATTVFRVNFYCVQLFAQPLGEKFYSLPAESCLVVNSHI